MIRRVRPASTCSVFRRRSGESAKPRCSWSGESSRIWLDTSAVTVAVRLPPPKPPISPKSSPGSITFTRSSRSLTAQRPESSTQAPSASSPSWKSASPGLFGALIRLISGRPRPLRPVAVYSTCVSFSGSVPSSWHPGLRAGASRLRRLLPSLNSRNRRSWLIRSLFL